MNPRFVGGWVRFSLKSFVNLTSKNLGSLFLTRSIKTTVIQNPAGGIIKPAKQAKVS